MVELTQTGLNPRFDMSVTFTTNYFFSWRRCPVDSEMLLVTDFMNLKIKSARSFRGAHRNRMYIHMFIIVNARMSIVAPWPLPAQSVVLGHFHPGPTCHLPPLFPPAPAPHTSLLPLSPTMRGTICRCCLEPHAAPAPRCLKLPEQATLLSLSLSHDQHRPDHLASLSDVKLKLRASITTHSDERHRGYPAAFLPSAPSWSDPLLLLLEQDSPEPSSPCR
jgi:hypothetical protein